PTARDWKDGAAPSVVNSGRTDLLTHCAQMAGWPTPIVNDDRSTHSYGKTKADGTKEIILKLPGAAKLTGWPTPTTNDENMSRTSDPQAYSERHMARPNSS